MKSVIEMAEDVGAGIADLPLEDAVLFEVDILSGRSAKLEAFAALVRADEREACAKLVDHILKEGGGTWGDAIRARGNK
jgi:hypothetical protein